MLNEKPGDAAPKGNSQTSATDVAANVLTAQALALGQSYHGQLEASGDVDWVKVELTAGTRSFFALASDGSNTVRDPYLTLFDADGKPVAADDNNGAGSFSLLQYTATSSGSYYLGVRATTADDTGGYLLSHARSVDKNALTTLPVFDYEAMANQLSHGYRALESKGAAAFTAFGVNADGGRTLSYSLGPLSPVEKRLAEAALQSWEDITGIDFKVDTLAPQIRFSNYNDRDAIPEADTKTIAPHTDSRLFDQFDQITSAEVGIENLWVQSFGSDLYSYSYTAYVHEIGHALGLGHPGSYNLSFAFPTGVLFANDTRQFSVMSYVDQNRSGAFFADRAAPVTPMIADILAMETLYGLSTTTRLENTTYGFNSTLGPDSVYNFASYAGRTSNAAMTVYDSGGSDTLDFSGFSDGQQIDLAPGSFSNIGGGSKNFAIYLTTQIENAIGGKSSDTISGNALDNRLEGREGFDTIAGGAGNDTLVGGLGADVLTGGTGADLFVFGVAADGEPTRWQAERIVDFSRAEGDRIDLSGIDADGALAGDQAFVLVDAPAFSSAGQLRYDAVKGMLYGNVDADADAEFVIQLVGVATLGEADFVL